LKILLVRLREIGDVVFTTPALRALRQHFPNAHLTYLVEPLAAPVVRSNPRVDEVIVAPRAHLLSDIALGLRLRARRYDLAIDFHGGPRASLLTWLSGAAARVGYDVPGRAWMYTRRVPRPRVVRARHAVENQWDLLAAIGIPPAEAAACAVEMAVEPASVERVADRLRAAGLHTTAAVLVVMHVSAGNPFRRWPQRAFAEVAAALVSRRDDASVIVTSGPSEQDAAQQVIELAREMLPHGGGHRVLSLGELSLPELRALLDRADLFIGGDSGPMHIAATSAVPIVALYGPTLPVRSAPWRDAALVTESMEGGPLECRPCDQRVCVPGDFRCLTRISAAAVTAAAERALAAGKGRLQLDTRG
jgi:lipopolysaccharide heptosyltransferase II